jgi:hypothetical protein
MKPNLRIIGFGYQIGSGKDTAADVLCNEFGYVKMRFADALKEAVSVVFGWPREKLDDRKFKAKEDAFWGVTPRTILQRVGTEAMRQQIRDDVWIKALELRIKNFIRMGRVLPWIVVPDVRFVNEAEAVKSWGGIVVRIQRPDNPFVHPDDAAIKHASETELDDYRCWDHTLINDGTLVEFITDVRAWHHGRYPHK